MKRILLPFAAIFLVACQPFGRATAEPVRFPYLRNPAITEVQRIACAPGYRSAEAGASSAVLDRSLPAAWRELGSWELVVLAREERDEMFGPGALRGNRLDHPGLRAARQRYGADAVLLFAVDRFDCYDPVAIGIRGHLVSTADGAVLWSASGHFDGRRDDVQRDLERWYRTTVGSGQERIGGWRVALSSPSLFARYVSDRLAASCLVPPAGDR